MSSKSTSKQFFPALTGYRAIAAWMIFIYHFMPFANPKYPQIIKNFVWQFHLSVDMFFVLSGFLITYRYFNDTPIHFRKYIVNRFARIYPMYFILTFLVFAVSYLTTFTWNAERTVEAVLSFTMTKALFYDYRFSGIPQGWTLTLEELFYFTAPFYFILIRKKTLWLWVLPILIFIFGTSLKYLTNIPANAWGFMQGNISTYIFDFFAGIALALLILKSNGKKILKFNYFTYLGIGMILLYCISVEEFKSVFNLKNDYGRALEAAFLGFLGIAPLIYGLIFENTFIRRFLSSKYMVLLGKASYIFYLIHKGFIPNFINDYISDNKLVIFILMNLLSVLMFTYIEEPLNHYLRKKLSK